MIPVLLEDEHLLAVDKPAGRIVIPGRGGGEPSLRREIESARGKLWVVHRLDRGTSGVLLLARTAQAHRRLNLAFDRREVEKRYLALVRGRPPEAFAVDLPLAPARRGRTRAARAGDPRARPAATRFRVLERFPGSPAGDLALLEAEPQTGRTHQIRVHLAAAGFPLAVDPDYGEAGPLRGPAGEVLVDRTPLHAARLRLRHPATGAPVEIEAPLPADLRRSLDALRALRSRDPAGRSPP